MDKLNNMRVFCRIVELGTFAAVAKEMNLSAMVVSKYIAQLEKSLGVVLLNRTTRSVNLTEAGHNYYNQGKKILEELDELDESTAQIGGSVKGELKICAPFDFGGVFMVSAIQEYQQQHSDVKIAMSLDNKFQNLRDGVFDIVIVVTDCPDEGVVARKIADTELGTYASPDYLREYGEPTSLDDLVNHRCLHYTNTPHGDSWIFMENGGSRKIKINWQFATNNGRALSQAASQGMGIVRTPKLSVLKYLQEGSLVEVLSAYKQPALNIYATYLQKRFYPAKQSTFVEFLIQYFQHKQVF